MWSRGGGHGTIQASYAPLWSQKPVAWSVAKTHSARNTHWIALQGALAECDRLKLPNDSPTSALATTRGTGPASESTLSIMDASLDEAPSTKLSRVASYFAVMAPMAS